MQLALMRELSVEPEKKLKSKAVILTARDLNIIEFITDMKFASVEDVYEKFFKVKLNSERAKSNLWARKRLLQLEQGRFLKAHKVQTDKVTYYTAFSNNPRIHWRNGNDWSFVNQHQPENASTLNMERHHETI